MGGQPVFPRFKYNDFTVLDFGYKNPKKVDYWAVPEQEIVNDVLKRANFPLPLAAPVIPWPKFTESAGKALAEAHSKGRVTWNT